MNALNSLRAEAVCPACGNFSVFEVLFRYGGPHLEYYRVGDVVANPPVVGSEASVGGALKVAAEALGWPCGCCRRNFLEFDVLIDGNVIVGLKPLPEGRSSHSEDGFRVI